MKRNAWQVVGILIALVIGVAGMCVGVSSLYKLTHDSQIPTDPHWTHWQGRLVTSETWKGTCDGGAWWIMPISSGSGKTIVLEGNPLVEGLKPVIHEAPGAFVSGNNCAFVQVVYIKNGGYFVYRIWTR